MTTKKGGSGTSKAGTPPKTAKNPPKAGSRRVSEAGAKVSTTKAARAKATRAKPSRGKSAGAAKAGAVKEGAVKATAAKRRKTATTDVRKEPVRVVAIGASAGGLEPVERFFDAMPVDSGLAFVIIQHLSPDFRSMMDQLLARHSTMMIVHAEDGMELEANVVYLNPPRTDLTLEKGRLRTREHLNPDILSLPIDSFFHSLAADQKQNAIGIIMSGTGSDGSRGGQSIRATGGTLIVQDPISAKFDSMPRAAMERNAASVIALPQEMPNLLSRLIAGDNIEPPKPEELLEDDPERMILGLLQRRYGADFGYYKQATVGRRIHRRALLNQIQSVETYAQMVAKDNEELEALYCDLLIGVTAFFRDMEAFDELAVKILPDLTRVMSAERPLRVWVAGCASGEEPYSLAILISEFARKHDLTLNLKIFATDIHFNSLEVAGLGLYPKDSLKGVPESLINDYFDVIGERYQVKQSLRKLVVFSPHNLIKDPPFTRMDLVTCRNLLIYLDDTAQRKVLALFHFALRKDGTLFLGPSETTSDFADEFVTVSKKWRIFRKARDIRLRESTQLLPLSSTDDHSAETEQRLSESRTSALAGLHGTVAQRQMLVRAYDKMLDRFAPPSLLTDRNGELVHIFGNADAFLQFKKGVFSKRIVDVLIPDLKLVVSAGLERALAQHMVPFQRKVTIKLPGGNEKSINVGIEKLAAEGAFAEFVLVTLERVKPRELPPAQVSGVEEADHAFYAHRVAELERDLKITEESLQSTIEELETSNEELQATNEELMASNEELQSTNEELHSVNEELYTVSAEHQRKIEELTELTDDMDNLLRATDIGTIFLDSEQQIRRFTPAAGQTFNLVEYDIGRPLSHITYRFSYDGLLADVDKVRISGTAIQKRIEVDGRAYFLRLLPYRSDREESSGAVLTMVDIQDLEDAKVELARQQRLYESVVQHQSDMICRFTPDTTLTFVNDAFCRYYASTEAELLGSKFIDTVPAGERKAARKTLAALEAGMTNQYEHRDARPGGKTTWLQWHRHAIADGEGGVAEIQAVGRDITALKQAQEELVELNEKLSAEEERFRQLYTNTPIMMHSLDEDQVIIEASEYWFNTMGYRPEEVIGRQVYEFLTEDSRRRAREQVLPAFRELGYCADVPYQMIKKDGQIIDVRLSAIIDTGSAGAATRSLAVVIEVTEQLRAERALEAQNAELARINDNLNQFAHIVSHDLTGPLRAIEHTTNWIEEDATPEARREIQEHIDRLKDQVTHLGSLLGDLLEYSRAGSSQHAAEQINLPRALNDIFDVLGKPAGMKLEVRSMPTDIITYRAPLLLVFRNLIENAVKYHDRKKGRITVGAEDMADHWVFSVEDDGPGIDPEFHEKILLPFRKLERKDKTPGNGMGLALVKKAVDSNGGELSIISNPAERTGTRFRFTWPKDREPSLIAAE